MRKKRRKRNSAVLGGVGTEGAMGGPTGIDGIRENGQGGTTQVTVKIAQRKMKMNNGLGEVGRGDAVRRSAETTVRTVKRSLTMSSRAFMGRENALAMYEYAVKQKYRFFSFGDATFLI